MKIYLIRHGMTKGNEEKRYTGHLDVSVSKKGKAQLKNIKSEYQDIKTLPVYTSTLNRTKETAKILFDDYKHMESLNFMNETNFGDFEGKTYSDLRNDPDYKSWLTDIYNQVPKNGESYQVFKQRVLDNFEAHVFAQEEDTIYVTHGGVIRVIMANLVDPSIDFFDWSIPNGKGYVLTIQNNTIIDYKTI